MSFKVRGRIAAFWIPALVMNDLRDVLKVKFVDDCKRYTMGSVVASLQSEYTVTVCRATLPRPAFVPTFD